MGVEELADHMERQLGRGYVPVEACTGAAGGAACGDLIRVSVALDPASRDGRVADAGFDASGCGAAIAAGSATVELVRGASLLAAARIGAREIAAELGGLSPSKHHAAELAADALHRALGGVARERARLAPHPSRALVAMSGGVDSAVAGLLIAESGLETVAVTVELWSDPENDGERSCCSAQAVRSARELAHGMGMAHFSIDLRQEFRAGVVDGWLADHAAGLTPNPCVRCNGNVRLDAMLEVAERLGARTLATGHYARVAHEDGDPLLRVAVDERKDQSYALAGLSPSSLARLRFPLGALTKPEVRERAARAGLGVARRPDSQDLCFLAGTRRVDFLERHGGLSRREGAIVDRNGSELGRHGGVHTVTVGQRHGVGVDGGGVGGAGMHRADGPLYVIATDALTGTVTVGSREELRTDSVSVRDVTLHRDGACVDAVKVRYRGQRMPCLLDGSPRAGRHERVAVRMLTTVERTAPGQVACLYAGDVIVGHGTVAPRGVMRVLALDYGSARCGCALSDPTGTIVTPIDPVRKPAGRRGLAAIARLVDEREVERVVVGLPISLRGEDTEQTCETRAFAATLAAQLGEGVPVELHDERFTTRIAGRMEHATSSEDSRAAAILLEGWLARSR